MDWQEQLAQLRLAISGEEVDGIPTASHLIERLPVHDTHDDGNAESLPEPRLEEA